MPCSWEGYPCLCFALPNPRGLARRIHGRSLEADFLPPQQVGKIDSSCLSEGMPAPSPGVDIKNFEFSVPRIKFEFHFRHAIESNTLQKLSPCRLHNGLAGCFHKRAGVAKLHGILPTALSDERGVHAPLLAYSAKRKLILSAARNAFLHHDLVSGNVVAHLRIAALEFLSVRGGESLQVRLGEETMIHGWFQNDGKREIGRIETANRGPRGCNTQFRRLAVR